jgi:hypothetical protein
VLLGVHDSDEHLGAAQIDTDRFAGGQRLQEGSGGGMRKY